MVFKNYLKLSMGAEPIEASSYLLAPVTSPEFSLRSGFGWPVTEEYGVCLKVSSRERWTKGGRNYNIFENSGDFVATITNSGLNLKPP